MPKDKINRDEIEEEYGLSYALFKAFPELNQLLNQAVKGSWTAQKFQVELRQTKWFKKHSDVWRQNTALKYADPATYRERLGNSMATVQNLMGAFGVRLGPKATKRIAERALLFGMSDDQIRDTLANHVKPTSAGHYTGQLSGIEADLRETALRNGVRVGKDQLNRWMKAIVRGDADRDQYNTYLRDLSAKTFEAYGDQIKGGMDLIDLASPYMQSMSEILELNPGSLDLYDKTVRKAMAGVKDKDGKVTPVSITDFEDQLRKDSRWQFTQNAKDTATGYTVALAKMWGLR